jgi:hydrogen peroxide-dependent heme synthase
VNDFETPYVLYAALRARQPGAGAHASAAADAEAALTQGGVVLRGAYALAGFRAEADLLLWLVGPSADALQDAFTGFRHSAVGRELDPFWTAIGVHREAEFSKSHIPAFLGGEEPRRYVCVYPYVRSLEWYLLEPHERSDLLREHGMMGREYPDVRANTVSAFALGDYEWLLAFEADELTRIVDLMRHLRGAEARRHTREELPFLTGIRKPLADVVAGLP